jgi:D-alanyl-D-alanine endopeptidase (penicillin-binding protein 7)
MRSNRILSCVLALAIALGSAATAAGSSPFAGLSGDPQLRSASALVLDSSGHVIFGKDVDTVRSIASITKLMTAMVVLDAELDLDETLTISDADRDLIRMTGSRLQVGATLTRRELLVLALMASENRAATALGRTYPGGMQVFVAAMNEKAAALGMHNSRFSDPAGLHTENLSTASDLAKMIAAAQAYPLIVQATTTLQQEVHPFASRGALNYANTNGLLKNPDWSIALSKTGYIHEAGRCLVMRANIRGEELSIVLLNSFGKLTPYGDSNRLRKWLLASG